MKQAFFNRSKKKKLKNPQKKKTNSIFNHIYYKPRSLYSSNYLLFINLIQFIQEEKRNMAGEKTATLSFVKD